LVVQTPAATLTTVSASEDRAPCVLLGNLEPIARLGMTRVLGGIGAHVESEDGRGEAIVEHARWLHPDTVVLGMEDESSRELVEQVRRMAPDTRVILWARDESEMEIFDRAAAGPRRVAPAMCEAVLMQMNTTDQAGEGA
jgi:DNA-binding NarL/FixJ family response regulator